MATYEDTRSYLASAFSITFSDDFWAGWISGVFGVIAGNPLDRRKVQLQSRSQTVPVKPTLSVPPKSSQFLSSSPIHLQGTSSPSSSLITRNFQAKSPLAGVAAPSLGVGVLNALLFMVYNRAEEALNHAVQPSAPSQAFAASTNAVYNTTGSNLWTTWLAGAAGGLVTSVINTPTELIKCRAQLASLPANNQPSLSSPGSSAVATPPSSSWHIAKTIWRTEGTRGLFHGGVVTALRDSIGYGFYFWAYELGDRLMTSLLTRKLERSVPSLAPGDMESIPGSASTKLPLAQVAFKDILCGGVAGVVTWASIFPLDVVKTCVQTQEHIVATTMVPTGGTALERKSATQIARELYIAEGSRAFFRGLAVCSVRAFFVNAVQWPVYKWTMAWLSEKDRGREE